MSLLNTYIPSEPVVDEVEPETSSLAQMVEFYDTVSQEAFVVGDLNNYLQRKAAKISSVIRDSFRHLTTFDFTQPERINTVPMARTLGTRDYTDLTELQVYIPVGFQGYLEEYVNYLSTQAGSLASRMVIELLYPLQRYLAHYVNAPGDTMDTRAPVTVPKLTLDELTTIKSNGAKFFITGNRRSTAELGDVFENKKSVIQVAETLNQLNQTLWRQVKPVVIERETEKVVKLATTLFNHLEHNDSNTSAEFIKNTMGLIKLAGTYVEWYATLQTQLADFTTAMKLNEKTLIDLG